MAQRLHHNHGHVTLRSANRFGITGSRNRSSALERMRTDAQEKENNACDMRQEEIFRVTWSDFNKRTKMLTIRDRKDPRQKKGNDQEIPLLVVSGYDALTLIEEQSLQRKDGDDRIFPYNHKSAGANFTRACQALEIDNLHFHDLRHEGTSRLFEAGLAIQQVALVTGHKDWKMLKRYTHLKASSLHKFLERKVA
jgi:integrase